MVQVPIEDRLGLLARLESEGFALVQPEAAGRALQLDLAALDGLRDSWERLPRDQYLRDGGHYRSRRHSCFVQTPGVELLAVPQRAHWQPTAYNALHGGMQRWFAPMQEATVALPVWQRLMHALADAASGLRGTQRWYVEAHQFRIDTADGIGRPTPEGAHRDGVDLVAVALVGRHNIKGGETRVFEAAGRRGERFTLTEPWSLLLLDDARVIHESTPIQPLIEGEAGWRDTLVVTCRAGEFQGD